MVKVRVLVAAIIGPMVLVMVCHLFRLRLQLTPSLVQMRMVVKITQQ